MKRSTSTESQILAIFKEGEAGASVVQVTRKHGISAAGEVVMCQLTRYEGSKTIEAWQCRVSGYVPAPAPGRKPKAA